MRVDCHLQQLERSRSERRCPLIVAAPASVRIGNDENLSCHYAGTGLDFACGQ